MNTTTTNTASGAAEYLDVNDLAALLRCSSRHVRKLVVDRVLPAPIRLGALTRWSRAVVVRWLEERGGGPAADRGGRRVQVR
ncbi:helix-turn-helix transcriptional regulator [Frigoriglobus tundricola]|nr:helix-turn-helix domain-containing protein [Frigoriglobus tundricola]